MRESEREIERERGRERERERGRERDREIEREHTEKKSTFDKKCDTPTPFYGSLIPYFGISDHNPER